MSASSEAAAPPAVAASAPDPAPPARVRPAAAPAAARRAGGPKHAGGHLRHDQVTILLNRDGDGRQPAGEQEERDRTRARMPLPGPRRIVVLGCTSGAGQTVTTLLAARMLASLRAEPVGALDLNPGDGSLARRSQCAPAGTVQDLLGAALPARPAPGIEVICAGTGQVPGDSRDDFAVIGERLAARYRISLIDPGAHGLAQALSIADQLVLVAPASGDAPRAVTMTGKWLDAHDHHGLAASAVLVLNGVSSRSLADVEQAEAVAAGRCRAIVRVPWEDQLGDDGGPCAGAAPLRRPAREAITELAGLLVSGPAARPGARR